MKLFRLLGGLLASIVRDVRSMFSSSCNQVIAQIRLSVRMECIGPDGKPKWADTKTVVPWWVQGAGTLRLVGLLIVGLIVVCLKQFELLTMCIPMRVATAGLNKYLDATLKTGLAAPAWYVGLIKAIATDGAMTSGSATLTSASNPFAAGDVGRAIIVRGAGAAGADLSTTISAFGSAGSVTLGANAGTTVSGASFAFEPRAADTMAAHSFVESSSYSNANRPTWTPGAIASGSVDNSASVAAFTVNASDYIFGAFLADNNTKGGSTGTLLGGGINSSGIARQVANGDTLNVTVTASLVSS